MSTTHNAANEFLRESKYRAALQAYLELIKENPGDGKAYEGVAQSYLGLKEYDSAASASQKAIELDKSLAIPHTVLAVNHLRQRDYVKALAEAQKAYELSPELEIVADGYGALLLGSGRVDESILVFKRALILHPGSVNIHKNLAVAYREKRDFKQTVEELRLVFKLKPSVSSAYQLIVAYQQRYAILVSLALILAFVGVLVFKSRIWLVVPAVLALQGLYADLIFIKEGGWRRQGKWKTLLFSLITDLALAAFTLASYMVLTPKK